MASVTFVFILKKTQPAYIFHYLLAPFGVAFHNPMLETRESQNNRETKDQNKCEETRGLPV